MAITAFVREWNDEEGWGVLDSTETPGGCFAQRGNAAIRGYATFDAGQEVRLEFEAAGQDGYAFRAFRFWPADQSPDRTGGPADQSPDRTGGAADRSSERAGERPGRAPDPIP